MRERGWHLELRPDFDQSSYEEKIQRELINFRLTRAELLLGTCFSVGRVRLSGRQQKICMRP